MEKQDAGFLNDTSLSKTPRSPLKTSTVMKPSGTRKPDSLSKRITVGDVDSLYLMPSDPTKALHEVTNMPNFIPKSKLNFTRESSFNDSSLGILHIDNFSDFTDSSMVNIKEPVRNKSKKSKSLMLKKTTKSIKENQSLNLKDIGLQNVNNNEQEDSSSSSDVEYDGTNIPELNMDYDALPTTHSTESAQHRSLVPDETGSSSRTDILGSNSIEKSMSYSDSHVEKYSVAETAASKMEESRNSRNSIFKTCEPPYDSFFKTLMANANSSDVKSSKVLEDLSCKGLDIDLSQMESILQNQSLAEQNFLKSLEKLNCLENIPLKFSADEISARSSSFGSPSSSLKHLSDGSPASSNAAKTSDYSWNRLPSNEDFEDEMLRGSLFAGTFNKKSEHSDTYTKLQNENMTDSAKDCKNSSSYYIPEKDCNKTIQEDFDCELNYKNASVFDVGNEYASSQKLQVSDSEFITSEEAWKLFQKDEEKFKQEHMFEMNSNNSKASDVSNFSPHGENNITAPSWFLDNNSQDKLHISIGTLISARTENLGRLSQDSNRERPFFGTDVHTPSRNETEKSSVSSASESSFQSSAPGDRESTLKSILCQSFQNNSETELLRESVLSRILNNISTTQPLELAQRIFEKCNLQDKTSHKARNFLDKPEQSSTLRPVSMENIFDASKMSMAASSNGQANKMAGLLTRSSSMNSLDRIERGSYLKEQEESVTNEMSVSNIQPNKQKTEINNATASGCSSCCFHAPSLPARPPSSCASSCNNPPSLQNQYPSQYGCMKYFSSSQDQCHHNAFPPYALQPSAGYSHAYQYHNPFIQDVFSSQVLNHPYQQGPVPSYPSHQFPIPGTTTICTPIQGPAELVFPKKISIGDSQFMNLTVQNLQIGYYFYHISCVSALVNGKPISLEISGVTLPRIIPRDSGSTTDIQVTLSPKYEGNIIVTIQIAASFSQIELAPSSVHSSFLQTKIQYESLRPSVSISYKAKDSLDLRTVIAGSTVKEHVTLSNKCDAAVPLCISLSSDMKDNRISFDLNQMKRQKFANSDWKMISPKAVLYRLPSAKNESVAFDLDIPIIFEAGMENSDASFVLTAAIETSTLRENLAVFRITASVGVAKLVLQDPNQSTVLLHANSCRQNLVVENHSSFNVVYDFDIVEDDTHSFSVSPTSVELAPMQTSILSVSFTPSTSYVVKGFLQAATQPHGKVFSLAEVIGDATSVQAAVGRKVLSKEPKFKKSGNILECNKKYLVWGGVDIGKSMTKTFYLRNSSNKSLQTKLYVQEKSKSFKLLDDSNQKTHSLTLSLATKEEKLVSVLFTPSKVTSASGFLAIKPLEIDQSLFSIPLIAYGGFGKLEVKGLTEKEGIGKCLDISFQRDNKSVFNSVTVHNTGSRALFVKVVTSVGEVYKMSAKGQVHVNLTEFVLLENENKVLYISSTVSEEFYSVNSTDFGMVTLLYGDEIMRQQIRSRNQNPNFSQNTVFNGINFDVPFDGEERVPYDSLFRSSPKFSSLFAASVKKFLIHINVLETNQDFTQMSFNALSVIDNTNLTVDSSMMSFRRLTTSNVNHSPPVKELVTTALNRLSMPLQNFTDSISEYTAIKLNENTAIQNEKTGISWTIKPDALSIDAGNRDNRVLLINLSNQDLKFRIECEIHVTSVSPVSGIIGAKGQIGLRITIIPYSYSKLSGDYQGYVKVICGGMEKRVHVTVLKDKKRLKDPSIETHLSAERKPKGFLEASSMEKTVMSSTSVLQNICNFPKEIILNTTVPGKVSETVVTVQNMENCALHWDIHPISMLLTESMEDSLNCANALKILPSSGSLQSKEATRIVIQFLPSRIDNYSRIYELVVTLDNGREQKSNFKVEGKSSSWLAESGDLTKSCINIEKSVKELEQSQRRRQKTGVCVESETCEFSATNLGQSSVAYVTLKNQSQQDVKVDIIKPHPPFFVKFSTLTLRKKTFQKIPITFKPLKSADIYEDYLEMHSEDGTEFRIKMTGICNFKL